MPHNYNILRTEKVKTRSQITQAAEHNFRLRTQPNIDPKKSQLNKVLINSLDASTKIANDLQIKLTQYYNSLGVKEKDDNVLMLEFVVSASPEFYKGKKIGEIQDWANSQVEFFRKEFGEQVKLAILHLDEKSPHIHFMVSTEQKTVKRYKNRYGESHKETWSLNAKRYNPEFLSGLHDRHAEHNKNFGLKRGVKGSMRKHKSLKEFYAIVDKALDADYQKQLEKMIQSLETGFLTKKVSIEELQEKFVPMMNKMMKQHKVMKEKYSLDIKDWATQLQLKADQLETKETEVENFKKHIGNSLKMKQDFEAELKAVRARAKELEEENERLKAKIQPKNPPLVKPQGLTGNKIGSKI